MLVTLLFLVESELIFTQECCAVPCIGSRITVAGSDYLVVDTHWQFGVSTPGVRGAGTLVNVGLVAV